MVSFKLAVGIVLAVSFFVFVVFFGRLPALRRTPVGALYRLLCVRIPSVLARVDNRLFAGRISRYGSRFGHYLMNERHPGVVIFFFLVMSISQYLFIPAAWPIVGWGHKLTMALIIIPPYAFLYICCVSDPGYITPENHAYHMSLYPYDHALFHPGAKCTTCGFLKPPRSKHCSLCKRCIAKADHHCIFINSCVGHGNQHWFILLLAATAIMCAYGGLQGVNLLAGLLRADFSGWSPWWPGREGWTMWLSIWGFGIQSNVALGAATLMSGLSAPLVFGLLAYTSYLVYAGTTTNESLKWTLFKEDMDDGFAFRRALPARRDRDFATEPICSRWPVEPVAVLFATDDGNPPSSECNLAGAGSWDRPQHLKEVENLYDLGLWDNFADVFVRDYGFGTNTYISDARQKDRKPVFPP